jgi:hypothetical protein
MIKKEGQKYSLTYREEINQNLKIIRDFFNNRLENDKTLKNADHLSYENLLRDVANLKNIREFFTLEEILDFSSAHILKSIRQIPKKIAALELAGLSVSHFTPKELSMNMNTVRENIFILEFYLPKDADFLILQPQPAHLLKTKNYRMIALFGMEKIAAPLRNQIAVTPLRSKKITFLNLIQRFGLIPVGNYQIMKPQARDTILPIGIGKNPIYYDTMNILNSNNGFMGLGKKYFSSEIVPITAHLPKALPALKIQTGRILETIDGVRFREMQTPFPDRLKRGPSPIANGYNILLNKKFKKRLNAPIIDTITLSQMLAFDRRKYMDFRARTINSGRNKIVEKFLGYITEFLSNYPEMKHKTMLHELKLNLAAERTKLNRKLQTAASIEDFFDDIIADKNNFIMRFERKMKIFHKHSLSTR